MARRERPGARRRRARDAARAAEQTRLPGPERWRRPSGLEPRAEATVAPPPPVRRLLVDVDGAAVEVEGMRVEGSPSAEELRGSLATLGLDDVDDAVRSAHAAFVASVRARGPADAARRALAVLHAIASWRHWGGIVALAGFAAAILLFGAPIWLASRPDEDLRGELGASALWTGASALTLVVMLVTLAIEPRTPPTGRPDASSQAQPQGPRTPHRPGVGPGGVVAMIVLLLWLLLVVVLLVVRTSLLLGWSGAVVGGLILHALAIAVWIPLLVLLRRGPGAGILPGVADPLDDLPEARLAALERIFGDRIGALDRGTWTALRSAMESQADRLLAAGAIDAGTRAAMLRVGPMAGRFDAALAARLAHDPDGAIVLRPHVPLPVVAAILRGRAQSAGLVRRVVAAVAGDRQDRGAPFDAAVLVDLVAAARVPSLARDATHLVALSRLWSGTVVAAWAAALGAVLATLLWLPTASDFRTPTSPTAAVALAVVAVVLLAGAELRERLGRLRALPTTIAWIGVAASAALAAALIDRANASSPYLQSVRAGEVMGLVVIALVASAAAAWRIAEVLRGRRHDAVHANSSEWPLSQARVAEVEALRRRRAGATGAALDDVAAEVEVALRLAAELGRLDPQVAESVATGPRRATWPECDGPIWGSPSR